MALPLLDIHTHYDAYCEYPTSIKIAFDDHSVQTYVLQNKMDYQFNRVLESINSMKVGYPKTKNRRNR